MLRKNGQNKLVSVIVPVYKVEQYLEKCVNSIRSQTHKKLEIILVDDGSPDSCGRICDKLQSEDNRVVVIHQKNGGLSCARNTGINNSHGDYITFVDGDDWLDNDVIEILIELCEDYNAEISECQYREVFSEMRYKDQVNTGEITILNPIEALEGMLDWKYFKPMAWGKLYNREVIKDIRFPLNKLHEDEFTTYKYIYNAHKLVHINLAKYNYNRMRENSITANFTVKNLDACEAFLERRNFIKEHNIQTLEEKMNNSYCIVVLDTLYKCYKENISGNRVEQLLKQVQNDIEYLQKRPVDIYFINELSIVLESLQKYGIHRDEIEEKNQKSTQTPNVHRNYEDILLENEQLKRRIDDLLNSRTWRYAEKAKQILGISNLSTLRKRKRYSEFSKTTSNLKGEVTGENKQLEFDYRHLLYEAEYKFYKYKKERSRVYPLDITKIKIPYKAGMVSIVLPVFNGEDYVSLSVESVLEQTYKNFELIIIDDGSTDTTPQIIDGYASRDSRIRVIHQDNLRLPRTLSKGFRMSRGEFFTWTSADNIMHKTFLEQFVDDLLNNPSVGMVWGNMRLIDENGCPIKDNEWYANSEYPEEVMFPRSVLELNVIPNNYIGAAFMYRAVCAHIVLDYSAYKFCTEDYDYWMKINELCKLRHTSFDETLYSYRFHPNSLTSKDKELKITENRYKLMLLDEFRRDYFLKPLFWVFQGDIGENNCYKKLKRLIEKAGHIVMTIDEIFAIDDNLYERAVVVNFNNESQNAERTKIPSAYRVLISTKNQITTEEWDCCIQIGDDKNIPLDLGAYRGWYTVEDCETILGLIDAKAKTKFLYDLEGCMDYELKEDNSISVVLCYSGNLQSLKACLNSIKNSDADVEVVLVIDRNVDSYIQAEIVNLYPQIKFIRSYSTDKVTQINMAIWNCSGDIVVFGEDDYLYSPGYFKEIVKVMSLAQIKVICGSVKCDKHMIDEYRSLLGESRFYKDGLLKTIDKNNVGNVAVKKDDLLMIGGLYHLTPALNNVCIKPSLYGLMQIIHNNRKNAIFKSSKCSVYRQSKNLYDGLSTLKKSEILGFYELELRLVIPYNTWPELVKKNPDHLDNGILSDFLELIRSDLGHRAQVDWIRNWYSTINSPMISIIVPVFNTEKELSRCVDSLLNQTFQNIEIVLVDDGSKDSSGIICDQYAKKDQRVRVIHKDNGGLSDARNCGIDTAAGAFIMFVDSDDWIDSDMCETLYHIALQEHAEIVECSYRNVYPDNIIEETGNTQTVITGNSVFALLGQLEWKYFKSVAWNKLYYRGIFSDGKRYPKGRFHEDEFFTHQAFYAANTLAYIDISKYNYWHGRSDSITGAVSENILDSCYALRERVDFVINNHIEEVEEPVKNLYCWILFDRLFKCYKAGVSENKLKELLDDIQHDKNNVLSWDVSEDYKTEYRILLHSYNDFCRGREDAEFHEKMRKYISKRGIK